MDTISESRIVGEFLGYGSGRIFHLADGTRWRQESWTDEPVYRDCPKAKLLKDRRTGQIFLDVEGTSSTVIMVADTGNRGGVGAV